MPGRAGYAAAALIALAAAGAPAGVTVGAPVTGSPSGSVLAPHVPGELLVRFREGTGVAAKSRVFEELGVRGEQPVGRAGATLVTLPGLGVGQALARFSGHPEVDFAEPNYLYASQAVPDDPQFHRLWGLSNQGQSGGTPDVDIHAPEAWETTTGSAAVLVAIIDTGIDYTHPDLAANIWINEDEVPENGIDDDGNGYVDDVRGWDFANDDNDPMDDHFHGTHVAGTVGAVGNNGIGVAGVNWQVRLLPLKFLDDAGLGTTASAIGAIDYAVAAGARILNNSWGGPGFSQALRLTIEQAEAAGALFVAAAGNTLSGGRDNDAFPFFPASYPVAAIIAVAATDHDDLLATFSNWGVVSVDLSAPGVDVYSTFPRGDYGYLNGTSMATPHVSGALALLMARFPGIEAPDAKALVLSRADPVPWLLGRTLTAGRLNAARLLNDPDDLPPGPVIDLAASNPDGNRVDLAWTATGDDGADGQASRYDLRFAQYRLDETSFTLARRAIGVPAPGPPGSRDGTRVTGLDPATRYWFALAVLDEYGNRSRLSNVVDTLTLDPAVVLVDPERLEAELFTGEATVRPLRLQNGGAGELTWEIVVEGIAPTAGIPDGALAVATVGGSPHPARPGLRRTASGAAGTGDVGVAPRAIELVVGDPVAPTKAATVTREITDSTAAAGTRYSYHEQDATGGHFKGIHRNFGAVQPVYAAFWVRPGSRLENDGYVVLRDSNSSDAIFFYASAGGFFYVNADVGGNLDVPYESETWYHVEFRNIDFPTTSFDYYVNGRLIQAGIRFRFPGVRDFAQLDLYSFDPGAEAWWDEIVLTAEPPVFPVVVQPNRGLLPPGAVADLNVTLDAHGLVGGIHDAELVLRSNDPARPEMRLPVRLRVTGAPDLVLSTTELDFGELFVGDIADRELEVRNAGTDVLRVLDVAVDHPDFSAGFEPFEIAPGERRMLGLLYAPRAPGQATATLTLVTDDPDEPSATVALRGTGLLPPDVRVSPSALSATLHTGETTTLGLQLANTGFSDLHWETSFSGDGEPSLESVLFSFDRNYRRVNDAIASGFPFTGGVSGIAINGGGDNMFNGGNFLSTDQGGSILYSDGVVGTHTALGEAGRYFTRKVPGLFLFAADLDDTPFFSVSGQLGVTSGGRVDGTVRTSRANGRTYRAFVKRSFGGARPSVNHLLIVEDGVAANHAFATAPSDDYHVLFGLAGAKRLYYLLWAGGRGRYYDDAATSRILEAFFDALRLGPPWIEVLPRSGTVAPSEVGSASVTLDAFGLAGGTQATMLRVSTNAPGESDTFVPVTLEVLAAPDIDVTPAALDFGAPFVGTATTRQLSVRNSGAARFTAASVETSGAGFESATSGFVLEPGETTTLGVFFRPVVPGAAAGMLHIVGDDPDEGRFAVPLTGQAVAPPVLSLAPERLEFDILSGDVVVRTLRIENLAGATLSFALEARLFDAKGAPADALAAAPPPGDELPVAPFAPRPRPAAALSDIDRPATKAPAAFAFLDDFEDGVLDGWSGVGVQEDVAVQKTAPDPRTPMAEAAAGADRSGATVPGPAPLVEAPLRVRPAIGTVAAGGSIAIEVTLDGERLVDGVHEGQILVRSNDPARPEVAVPVVVRVTGEPLIATSTSRLVFGAVPLGFSQTRSVTVINAGTATLNVTEVRAGPSEFTVGVTSFALPPGGSRSVNVTFRPRVTGAVPGGLTLVNDSRIPEYAVTLVGTGVEPAELHVEPEELVQVQFRGEAVTRTLRLRNDGGLPLTWSVTARATVSNSGLRTVPLFSDDMEDETADWTPEAYGADSLWWRDPQRFHSASHGWSCTTPGGGTYDTGRRVGTAVISPPIDLRGAVPPVRLRFQESYETEPGRDQCMVDLRVDRGGPWQPLRGSYGAAPSGNSEGWVPETLDLTPWAGEIVRIRFYFETLDATNNNLPGWSFDDVSVTATGTPWVAVSPAGGTIAPGAARDIAVTFTALEARPAATYLGELEIASSDPHNPLRVVPVRLDVVEPPRIALQGQPVEAGSNAGYTSPGARTAHRLLLGPRPAGPGVLTVDIHGDFEDEAEHATVTAEALTLGRVGGGGGGPCGVAGRAFQLSAKQMAALAADGAVEVAVRNSIDVGPDCPDNRHVVRLAYVGELTAVDFGEAQSGETRAVEIRVSNIGDHPLAVTAIASDAPAVTLSASGLTVAPGANATLTATWNPGGIGVLVGSLTLATNDPSRRRVDLPLRGVAVAPAPRALATPAALEAALPPGTTMVRTLTVELQNRGTADLLWQAEAFELGEVAPAGGTVAPGGSVGIEVRLAAAGLAAGEHAATVALTTNDPLRPRIEIPVVVHAKSVELEVFEVDFTPKYAGRQGTVEVTLRLPPGHDPRRVLVDTVALEGVAAEPSPVRLVDLDQNGSLELVLQFDAARLLERLPPGTTVPVRILGEVDRRAWFHGETFVRGVADLGGNRR